MLPFFCLWVRFFRSSSRLPSFIVFGLMVFRMSKESNKSKTRSGSLISNDPLHRLSGTGKQGACNGGWIADGLGWKGGPKDLFLRIALEMHHAVSRVSRLADPKGLVFTPSILGGSRPAAILGTRRGMPLARVEVEKPVESNQNQSSGFLNSETRCVFLGKLWI